MKQKAYETLHEKRWRKVERLLAKKTDTKESREFKVALPIEYRQLCYDYSIARARNYSPQLISRLNTLVMQLHQQLYRQRPRYRYQWLRFIAYDFPDALRANARLVWIAIGLFVLPGLVMGVLTYVDEDMLYTLMSWQQVREFEQLYSPDNHAVGRERESDTDLMMFGFYIYNNIGISFRTFASGLLFCVGSIFFLVYNGLFIGGVAGHIMRLGYDDAFFPFVIGHGAFELTAIAFSGAAGMKLGMALVMPGELGRAAALRFAARDAIKIMYGVGIMLFLAAFIEAFWSSSDTLPVVRYSVGSLLWLLVIVYCVRRRN